jgi:peptide subunit release factor 1 (eRF1)
MNSDITKKFLEDLSSSKSSTGGTNLITYFVPSLYNMTLVSSHFNTELNSSQNIKDKSVREGVKSAIKSIIQLLKNYNNNLAPNNGLVLLGGEIKSCI